MPPDEGLASLLRVFDAEPPGQLVGATARHLRDAVGASETVLYVVDYGERSLVPLHCGQDPEDNAGVLDVDDSTAGTAYRRNATELTRTEDGAHEIFVPLTVRSERLGVLAVRIESAPGDAVILRLQETAKALAYVLLGARGYTDVYEQTRRRRPLELPAEIQWELLPVLAYQAETFSLAGSLEPAYEIGGDTFDYVVDGDLLTVGVIDAMGHGLRAALLSSLAVQAQRNARRAGAGLAEQVETVAAAVRDQFGGDLFVTQLLLRIDVTTGAAAVVNAGHPPAYRLRGDHVELLRFDPDLPAALFPDVDYREQHIAFEPEDRLVIVSDGVLENADEDGNQFGEGRLIDRLLATRDNAPLEVVRNVTGSVRAHAGGQLADDATIVCVDLHLRA